MKVLKFGGTSVGSAERIRKVAGIVTGKGKNIVVLSDEVYEHLIYDGRQHLSALSFPELRERSFVVGSFGKTFHVTGWKTGYCIAAPALMQVFRQIYQFANF